MNALRKRKTLVDSHVNVQDLSEVAWRVFNNINAEHDLKIVHGPLDVLDYSSPYAKWGAKFGIDATKTWAEERGTFAIDLTKLK